jgi:hypothetical protein
LANQIFIFGHGEWDVYDGGHWLDVMNEWKGLKMKIRPPARHTVPVAKEVCRISATILRNCRDWSTG